MTNTYYKEFREFLLDELEIFELCLTPRDLFRHINADVGTCIIFGQKKLLQTLFLIIGYQKRKAIKLIDRLLRERV